VPGNNIQRFKILAALTPFPSPKLGRGVSVGRGEGSFSS